MVRSPDAELLTSTERNSIDPQQHLLGDGFYLLGMKNADPADLALKATASAP